MPNNQSKKLQQSSKDFLDRWLDHTRIEEGDSSKTKLYKVAMKILGILLLIIFSPLILLILMVAVMAAL